MAMADLRHRLKAWMAALAGGPAASAPPVRIERDLRLDFFRGLSLFFIFIDHIPGNVMSNLTVHTIAFSNAAEIFIFISGYTAALVYGQLLMRRGPLFATVQVYHRVWQLYVAHVFIFFVYTAEVSYAISTTRAQSLSEELRLNEFLREPHVAIVKILLLQYQPELLDILPLYIVLLAIFPAVLLLQRYWPLLPLLISATVYFLARYLDWELPTYPNEDGWFFNPYAWQFLFVIGATAGHGQITGRPVVPPWRWMWQLAIAVAIVCAAIKSSWTLHEYVNAIPAIRSGLEDTASDKSNLSPARLISFFALTLAIVHFVSRDSAFLRHQWAKLVILCGQHSLQVFCLGILLSVLGRFILTAIAGGIVMQIVVSLGGIALMIGLALLLSWYKEKSRVPPAGPSRQAAPGTGTVPAT